MAPDGAVVGGARILGLIAVLGACAACAACARPPGRLSCEVVTPASVAIVPEDEAAADRGLEGVEECIEERRRATTEASRPPAPAIPDAGEPGSRVTDLIQAHLELSDCETKAGRLIEALRAARDALDAAIKEGTPETRASARHLVEALLPRLAKVTFVLGGSQPVEDFKLSYDERPLTAADLGREFTIDPGVHRLEARGRQKDAGVFYAETVRFAEGERRTVRVDFVPIQFSRPCVLEHALPFEVAAAQRRR